MRPQVWEKSPHRTIICICSNKWLKNNEEKKINKKNYSMQVILIWNFKESEIFYFVHGNIVDPLWTFLLIIFTKKNVGVPHHRWLPLFFRSPRSYEYKKKKSFLSTYRFCNLNLLRVWTASALRLDVKISKSGLYWESRLRPPAGGTNQHKPWCHSESVTPPPSQTSWEVGPKSPPGVIFSKITLKSRSSDECV